MCLDRYYLAYGSNLHRDEMEYRAPYADVVATGLLDGYKLAFKYYLTVEKCEGGHVPVALYKVTEFDKKILDKYESYPQLYHIENVDVTIDGTTYPCFMYVMNDGYPYNLPEIEYYKRCLIGYIYCGFDEKYLDNALEEAFMKEPYEVV